jgi:hypothetical protein
MTAHSMRIHGELYVTVQEAASCYQLEVTWVEQAVELELLGPVEESRGALLIPAAMLDRLARIRRLHLQTGMDLATLAWFFTLDH